MIRLLTADGSTGLRVTLILAGTNALALMSSTTKTEVVLKKKKSIQK